MDAQTVLEIIELMDNRLTHDDMDLNYAHDENPDFWEGMPEYNFQLGYHRAYADLKEFLQNYIENQISHMETEQGM